MQGKALVQLYDTPDEAAFQRNIKENGVAALHEYDVLRETQQSNMVFDILPAMVFYGLFGGATPPDNSYIAVNGKLILSSMSLLNTDAEPTYQEYSFCNATPSTVTDNVGPGSGIFLGQSLSGLASPSILDKDAVGKESIHYRMHGLWLPSYAVSNQIKSVSLWSAYGYNPNNYSTGKQRISRIRLKDTNGNPTTWTKTAQQTLYAEYTFYLTSV